jgi:hypothetical protein
MKPLVLLLLVGCSDRPIPIPDVPQTLPDLAIVRVDLAHIDLAQSPCSGLDCFPCGTSCCCETDVCYHGAGGDFCGPPPDLATCPACGGCGGQCVPLGGCCTIFADCCPGASDCAGGRCLMF